MLMRISAAARQLGMSTDTLRQWHKLGILTPRMIGKNRMRYYTSEDLKAFMDNPLRMNGLDIQLTGENNDIHSKL